MNHAIDFLICERRGGRFQALSRLLSPFFPVRRDSLSPNLALLINFFHLVCGNHNGSRPAMASDSDTLALNCIEELAKLVLRFG